MEMFIHGECTSKRVPSNFHFLSNANGAFKATLDVNRCIRRNYIKHVEDGKEYDNVEN